MLPECKPGWTNRKHGGWWVFQNRHTNKVYVLDYDPHHELWDREYISLSALLNANGWQDYTKVTREEYLSE